MSWNTSGMHTVQVRAIDGDGASSEAKQGTLMVHNVPPTVTGLIPYEAVIEDNPLELTVVPDDTPSDMETLEVCWDLDAKFDADNDGEADNDCEKTGASIVASWPTESIRMVTVTVTDDDGAIAQQSMNVSVINRAPVAVLETMDALEDLTEGDNLTLTGFNSNDTANDNLTLVYRWDASHLDTDLDGAKTGDVDHTGQTWTIENLPAGTLTFVLTVIDDDGLSDQKEITVLVAEAPPDGIFETISSAVGTTTALVIGVCSASPSSASSASCCSPVEGSRMRRTLGCLNKASLPQTRKPWRPYRKRNRLRNRRPLKQWRLNLNRWKPTGRPSRLQRPSAAVHRFPQPGFQKGGQWSSGTTTASSGSQPISPHLPPSNP